MIVLYNILFFIGMTLSFPLILLIVLLSDKRRKTVLQRLGLTRVPNFQFPIWIHALSVGEVLSVVPLVKALKKRFGNIVFSASTKTGFDIANTLLKEHTDAVFFFPYDLIFSVKHLAKQISPALVIIVETDIWPNFLFEMKKRNIPVLLVNARLSKKSFLGYQRLSFFTKPLFLKFSEICAQSDEDTRRFGVIRGSSDHIRTTGNIKFDQANDSVTAEEAEQLRKSMKVEPSRKILLAGSTHKGEEEIILDVFSRVKKKYDDLLLIIVPRDPGRASAISRIFKSPGFSSVTMSELGKITPGEKTDVIIIDTIGLLRKLYAVADIAFVGGSLVCSGGHNPLEPAVFSKPIIFGHDMSDFAEIATLLLKSGGAVQVRDAESFYEAVIMFLSDPKKAQCAGYQAFKVFYANKGAVEKILQLIENYQK
ncbi:3-deoxy-D-manno-octulosonic acid transferase [Desulfonema magnum]|uniref:3-deoxy-D-manno-octulosonic acid transferase n=1 Tax=Desulfonema magnum TaxID=45655 RepID=A0A975GRF9_9BACT|nr:3-deoxy-D-manno-octulosonic acid transferase [Desulfonema magnum]QTA91016.1 3-deoxy-D-manno-octulosonic acid transferase [Desulfonema magnum]